MHYFHKIYKQVQYNKKAGRNVYVTQLVRFQPIKPNPWHKSKFAWCNTYTMTQIDTCTFPWRLLIMMVDTVAVPACIKKPFFPSKTCQSNLSSNSWSSHIITVFKDISSVFTITAERDVNFHRKNMIGHLLRWMMVCKDWMNWSIY